MAIYIAAGVTSNLFASLLPSFQGKRIFATIRESSNKERVTALQNFGVEMISLEEGFSLPSENLKIMWLSTHDEPDTLARLAKKAPTLAMASGAIMDFFLGKQSEDQLNSYQKSKLAICRVPDVVAFIPGFFIEDVEIPTWASKGLHGDTTLKIFSRQGSSNDFDWKKSYSVTPKSSLIVAINEWLNHPQTFAPNVPIIVCSDRQFSRMELHEYAMGALINPQHPLIYLSFPHATTSNNKPLYITDELVSNACKKASALIRA